MLVIADTNFLIYCAKYRIFHGLEKSDVQIVLPASVLHELEKLREKSKNASDREAANLAATFIMDLRQKGRLLIRETKEATTDDAIFNLAMANAKKGVVVATHDKELMKKLKKAKINLIGIRQKRYIAER